ncbi:uncharacterized protein EI97DRAFT_406091 [Westerdykella ornata]|uniref:Zn(2)-C6 fungal-type domain-containing protein n=1 Tax=Westerdykella ornata TaxID=318751 RepID=A0A6A6JAG5_WESOR|nr:uncharacterized protein EI97DRAFT_406091 [Westerdykella ornata]KAF2272616.1 hypothetical protein EI97DRAFT_406091 [Westerdykella ornata]
MDTVKVARKGCGNCRERKIRCDRNTPACLQCIRTNRVCKGYGLRLSWPRPNDKRRAMVANHLQLHLKLPNMEKSAMDARLIHAYASDVALHYHLSASLPAQPGRLHIPVPFGSTMLGAVTSEDRDLLLYFERHASRSLPLLGDDPSQVGTLLIRMALTGNTPSATAVLYALLAVSSLHQNGIQEQAIKYKISALNKLALASRTKFGVPELLQHIAAGMLLGSFEVHQASSTSGQWLCYVNGVKKVLDVVCPTRYHTVRDEEKSVLLKWVHYHDVLARFALRHWTAAEQPICTGSEAEANGSWNLPITLAEAAGHFDRPTGIATLSVLEILREVCDAVPVVQRLAVMTVGERDDYVRHLQALDWRLRNIDTGDQSQSAELRDMVNLYRLAVLIYLHRATEDVLGFTATTEKYLDEAFEIFARLEACERQFPLFILGAEARTEEERAVVLELMSRTEGRRSSRLLTYVRALVNAVWTQQDLSGGALNYREKITAVISACSIVPSLV